MSGNPSGFDSDEEMFVIYLRALKYGGSWEFLNVSQSEEQVHVTFLHFSQQRSMEPAKDVKTSICVVLTQDILKRGKVLNDIRKKHDKTYDLWMANFKLLHPFIPETHFAEHLDRIQEVSAFVLLYSCDTLGSFCSRSFHHHTDWVLQFSSEERKHHLLGCC